MTERKSSGFEVLRNSNFTWFLAGTTLTNAAVWIQNVTISWIVYDITSSGMMLGTVNLLRSVATLGLATFAGVAIDRYPRKKLLFATSTYMAILCVIFALIFLRKPDVIWPLLLFSLLGGVGQAMSMPLRQTVVFDLVNRDESPGAVSLVQTGWALMRSIGPAIGGFLILWFGPGGNFFVQAIAYGLVLLTVLNLKLNRGQEPPTEAEQETHSNFIEGWRYIVSQPTTLAFLLLSFVLPLFIIPNFSTLPSVYAKDIFDGGADTLGTLMSAMGVGGIIGGFLSTALGKVEHSGVVQVASLFLIAVAFAAFAMSTTFVMGIITIALAGMFEMVYITTNQTMLQLSIPDEIRGRVTGIISLKSGLTPVGAFFAGIGADLVGPQIMTFLFAGMCALIAVVVYLLVPIVRKYRLSDAL